jgi:hypothetical protein
MGDLDPESNGARATGQVPSARRPAVRLQTEGLFRRTSLRGTSSRRTSVPVQRQAGPRSNT